MFRTMRRFKQQISEEEEYSNHFHFFADFVISS